MGIGQYKAKYKDCNHDWELHVDVESTSGPASGNTVFLCRNCGTIITMLEKNSLESLEIQEKTAQDSLASQKESQIIQERNIKISMWANIIATATVLIAFIVLLFGEGIVR